MTKEPEKDFQKKVWTASAIVALLIILLWIIKVTFNVFLLILSGVLIALFFRGLSGIIQRKTKMNDKLSLVIAIVGSLLLVGLFFWFAGNRIQHQVEELTKTLPQTIDHFKTQVNKSGLGKQVFERLSSQDNTSKAPSFVQTFFKSTFGVLGDMYVVLFLGIFFTVSPKTYVDGFIKLIPVKAKAKTKDVINKVGATLTKWLKGQLLAMLIVAVLTAIGLSIIGMPMALVLALIAGLLNFIPNFGPLIAMIPAVLVGLMQGTTTALIVAGLYIFIQVIESNLITPQIQKKLINIPPALIIIAQLFMGVLTGGLGLILATPLTAILMVVIQETWIRKQNAPIP
ncbi:MAG TPA: AI-2E family transporter [Chitinophagaceae bacterium]|nr:AI-2E family transporter [Chitinophagaceae bacterium]